MKTEVAVLDFGSSKITVLVGEKAPNNTFHIKANGESVYAGFMDGEFLETRELKTAITLAINNAEINLKRKIKSLYIGVPAEFVYSSCKELKLSLPSRTKIKQKHIRRMFENANIIPEPNYTLINKSPIYFKLDDNNKLIDPIACVTSSLTCLASFIMVCNNFHALLEKVLYEIGIYNYEFISSSLAESVYLIPKEEREKGAMLVDCGYITTSVTSVVGEGITELKSFSVGGGHITSDLAELLKIPFYSAEQLKRKIILSLNASSSDEYEVIVENSFVGFSVKIVNEIALSRIDMIMECIEKSIGMFQYPAPQNVDIYLTGGGLCYIRGIKDYLSRGLGRNVKIIAPMPMQFQKPEIASAISILDAGLKLDN